MATTPQHPDTQFSKAWVRQTLSQCSTDRQRGPKTPLEKGVRKCGATLQVEEWTLKNTNQLLKKSSAKERSKMLGQLLLLHGWDWNFTVRRNVAVVQFLELPVRARRSITFCHSCPQKTHTHLQLGFGETLIQAIHLLTCKFTEWHFLGGEKNNLLLFTQWCSLKNASSSIMLSLEIPWEVELVLLFTL